MKARPLLQKLFSTIAEKADLLLIEGPRHVGKSTLVLQTMQELQAPFYYINCEKTAADAPHFLEKQIENALQKHAAEAHFFLVVDEVQKLHSWQKSLEELLKAKAPFSLVLITSQPWIVQKELESSSFSSFHVPHWSYPEMEQLFGFGLEKYLYFGGYPSAAPFADENNSDRWTTYMRETIIEHALTKDCLSLPQITKPNLLKGLFTFGCINSGWIISYSKLLEDLPEAMHSHVLPYYLNFLYGAGLVGGLQKFSGPKEKDKTSIPKFCVFNTALEAALSDLNFKEAMRNRSFWAGLRKSAVGAHLINQCAACGIELLYWREGDKKIDYILKRGDRMTLIEIKGDAHAKKEVGMAQFIKSLGEPTRIIVISDTDMPLELFLSTDVEDLL